MDNEIIKQRFKVFLVDRGVHFRPVQNVTSGTSTVLHAYSMSMLHGKNNLAHVEPHSTGQH
jgi:hypothetical protein